MATPQPPWQSLHSLNTDLLVVD